MELTKTDKVQLNILKEYLINIKNNYLCLCRLEENGKKSSLEYKQVMEYILEWKSLFDKGLSSLLEDQEKNQSILDFLCEFMGEKSNTSYFMSLEYSEEELPIYALYNRVTNYMNESSSQFRQVLPYLMSDFCQFSVFLVEKNENIPSLYKSWMKYYMAMLVPSFETVILKMNFSFDDLVYLEYDCSRLLVDISKEEMDEVKNIFCRKMLLSLWEFWKTMDKQNMNEELALILEEMYQSFLRAILVMGEDTFSNFKNLLEDDFLGIDLVSHINEDRCLVSKVTLGL